MKPLLGKPVADKILAGVKEDLRGWGGAVRPRMVSVLASEDPASAVYVSSKQARAAKLGLDFDVVELPSSVTQDELEGTLDGLSRDPTVHGIVLELPLAKHLDADAALQHITHRKDIEGLTPRNLALIAAGREPEALLPPTPRAIRFLLREAVGFSGNQDELQGLHVAIVGPGRTVGRPLAFMLNNRGVTVTLCNQFSDFSLLAAADAVVMAVGSAGLLLPEHVRDHHIVIDAGINVAEDGRVLGDAQPELPVRFQTPVPGGVGPVTSALMYQNLVRAVKLQRGELVD